jgi:hypothetical protein
MALPSSGSISMSQINTELGRSSTAAIALDTAENGGYATINVCSASRPSATNPATMSEWRGYNHTASCGPTTYTVTIYYNIQSGGSPTAADLRYSFNGGSDSVASSQTLPVASSTVSATISGIAAGTVLRLGIWNSTSGDVFYNVGTSGTIVSVANSSFPYCSSTRTPLTINSNITYYLQAAWDSMSNRLRSC